MTAILALMLAGQAAAADVSWTVAGDTSALVGTEAHIVYRPTVSPLGAKLEPDVLDSATTSFAVVKAEAEKDGSWTWTVLPLDEGMLSFVARWKLDGQDAAAPPVTLPSRAPAVAKDAEIFDIKGPLAARRAWWPWLISPRPRSRRSGVGALACRWRARPAGPERLGRTGRAAAFARGRRAARVLPRSRPSQLWEQGEHAAYYLRLTDILRVYLEARYGEPATAMTSVEVARLMKAKQPDLKAAGVVRKLLQRADLVKFARIKPEPGDGPNDARSVLDVVRATTPRAPTAAAGGLS